ncbi:MAG: 16S rRNA (guanine(966)-N(2))-methyltransferase RsmD [Thermodesulfobacteriota bacterium]|nr:MAG: 16S rRNA (guanine(966)-N(2))-methyltransferase RsmD [Thermodesulfobacteriota bacterium]
MRIIGGRLKGRRLASFRGLNIRPTSDKVREAVFNILPREFPFRTVLDIYAGTGAMGIEAISRGASEATFVESDKGAAQVIRKNLDICGQEARIIRKDAVKAVEELSRKGDRFDLIIIDPPYSSELFVSTLKAIGRGGLVSPEGVIIAESAKRAPLVETEIEGLTVFDQRKYGDTLVYFLKRS